MSRDFETLVDVFEHATETFAFRPAFGTKLGSGWRWTTYDEFRRDVDALRAGLAALGLGAGDRIALISNNRLEWAVAAYAAYGLSAAIVPLYEAQPEADWAYVLRDSGAKIVLVSTAAIHDKLLAMQRPPALVHVLGMELPPSDERSYAHVLARGREKAVPITKPRASDPAAFLYTSGTTGEPKGVVLSHGNFTSNLNALAQLFPVTAEDRSLAFLPWAHALGQTADLHKLMAWGCSIAINDELPKLLDNLREIGPSILVAVPRIFNRIYDSVNAQIAAKPAPLRSLFASAIAAAKRRSRGEPTGFGGAVAFAIADKLIFSKVRAKVGGRLRYAVSGSAALNPEVAHFVDALGIDVYEGYGLTETSPVVSVNYPGHRKLGSVGKPLPGVRVEIDTKVTGDPENGEIVVYGGCVMQGYHGRPEETAAVMTPDGGLRTGDMGRLDADGFLYITGRIKEQYKLETGKYVVPSPLEEKLKLSPYIANAMIYGDAKPYNVALLVPDKAALERWAKAAGHDLGDIIRDEKVRKLVASEIERLTVDWRSYERPKSFALLAEDFTVENGMLTPSLKLKRRVVLEHHGALVQSLYKSA